MIDYCSKCKYWRSPFTHSLRSPGECRAGPAFYQRLENDWCGQFESEQPANTDAISTFSVTKPPRPEKKYYLYLDVATGCITHSSLAPSNADYDDIAQGQMRVIDITKPNHPMECNYKDGGLTWCSLDWNQVPDYE